MGYASVSAAQLIEATGRMRTAQLAFSRYYYPSPCAMAEFHPRSMTLDNSGRTPEYLQRGGVRGILTAFGELGRETTTHLNNAAAVGRKSTAELRTASSDGAAGTETGVEIGAHPATCEMDACSDTPVITPSSLADARISGDLLLSDATTLSTTSNKPCKLLSCDPLTLCRCDQQYSSYPFADTVLHCTF